MINLNIFHKCNLSCCRFFAAVMLFFISLAAASPVRAQQADADFSAYCRANFNNSAYQRFAQSWGTEHACVQGGTRQGIDLAEACFLTTGSRNYEVSGTRVLCDGNADDAPVAGASDLGELDISQYCNENFPNSIYENRASPEGINHYCRRPGATGGFSLQPVDLAAACQTMQGINQYRNVGARVFCTSAGDGASLAGDGGGSGGGGGATASQPARQDNGSNTPAPDDPIAVLIAEKGEGIFCRHPALGGEWRSGTLPIIDKINEDMDQRLSKCSDPDRCPNRKAELGITGLNMTMSIYHCHQAFLMLPAGKSNDDIRLATEEACEIRAGISRFGNWVIDGGLSLSPLHDQMLNQIFDQAEMDELCNCEPKDIPDFAARVEELKLRAERKLIAEFSQ